MEIKAIPKARPARKAMISLNPLPTVPLAKLFKVSKSTCPILEKSAANGKKKHSAIRTVAPKRYKVCIRCILVSLIRD